MSNVDVVAARTSPSIEEEWFSFLVGVKNSIQVAMTEEQSPTKPAVGSVPSHSLESFEDSVVDEFCVPFSVAQKISEIQ